MVWDCITWNGTGRLYRIDGRMDATKYCEILDDALLGTLRDHHLRRKKVFFQQDNDPKHTSRLAQAWFRRKGIKQLAWPASSPDMNIIENMWYTLDRRIHNNQPRPRNVNELWGALEREWATITVEDVRNLYRGMARRVAALKLVRGWHTKY